MTKDLRDKEETIRETLTASDFDPRAEPGFEKAQRQAQRTGTKDRHKGTKDRYVTGNVKNNVSKSLFFIGARIPLK